MLECGALRVFAGFGTCLLARAIWHPLRLRITQVVLERPRRPGAEGHVEVRGGHSLLRGPLQAGVHEIHWSVSLVAEGRES